MKRFQVSLRLTVIALFAVQTSFAETPDIEKLVDKWISVHSKVPDAHSTNPAKRATIANSLTISFAAEDGVEQDISYENYLSFVKRYVDKINEGNHTVQIVYPPLNRADFAYLKDRVAAHRVEITKKPRPEKKEAEKLWQEWKGTPWFRKAEEREARLTRADHIHDIARNFNLQYHVGRLRLHSFEDAITAFIYESHPDDRDSPITSKLAYDEFLIVLAKIAMENGTNLPVLTKEGYEDFYSGRAKRVIVEMEISREEKPKSKP